MQRLGVYGGTFDPVHYGHLILAREAAEQFGLEKVLFVPAAASPFKGMPLATGEVRLQMLRAATACEELFEIDECELQRPSPSYTAETVESLRKKYPAAQLFLLLGDDNLAGLPNWRRFEEVREMVTFIVLSRAKHEVSHEYRRVNRRIDISATEVRERIAMGQSIHYFVPAAVEEIIRAQRLYEEVPQSIPIL